MALLSNQFPCPHCHADAGQPCRTANGRTTHAHAERLRLMRETFPTIRARTDATDWLNNFTIPDVV